ncbi:MAG: PASTA domain-containing protein [bacterium]|nr:PASTA domain-containing protein [bacterium]
MSEGLSIKSIFKTLALAGLAFVAFLFLAMLFTGWFTRHGESVKVPNVVGMSAEKGFTVLDDEGLEQIIIDSVYKEDIKPMTIVEQDPVPDMNVKPGRYIYVIINTGVKPKVKMPLLTNGSANLALVLIKNLGLKLGRIDSVNSSFGSGLVIRQKYKGNDIPANTLIEKGSIIDISVSKRISRVDSSANQNLDDNSDGSDLDGL